MSLQGMKISPHGRPCRFKFRLEAYWWDGTYFRADEEDAKVVEAESAQAAIKREFSKVPKEIREEIRWDLAK